MATYVSLISFTERGEEHFKNTVSRANAFRQTAQKLGGVVREVFWTMGELDGVLVFEADDDETATALMLSLGSQGNVRTQTMRAFRDGEMSDILNRLS